VESSTLTKRIPTNLITGFLGVGKTTAMLDLLRNKPTNSRWAILVNEYGEVGVDQAILEGDSPEQIEIREISGGCICCTSSILFKFALSQILGSVQPERLLIETTGVGHPARLLEELRGPHYRDRVDLRATICLVSPTDFITPPMYESPVFRDQMELADVLVLNKADTTTQAVQEEFLEWGQKLYPPKTLVAVTQKGKLDPAWLDLGFNPQRQAKEPLAHESTKNLPVRMDQALQDFFQMPSRGQPLRKPSANNDACGWIFHPDDIFDEDRLLTLFASQPKVTRLKGVFHTQEGWFVIHRVENRTTEETTSYRRDSRIEIFAQGLEGGWEEYERRLLECLIREDAKTPND
jgi:G3E family GTPase